MTTQELLETLNHCKDVIASPDSSSHDKMNASVALIELAQTHRKQAIARAKLH